MAGRAASAAPEAAERHPPSSAEGTVSPSGKFTPANLGGVTNVPPPRTPAEAEAALRQGLNVRQTGSNTFQIGRVEFDRQLRTVTVPARVTIRSQVVEYALVNERGKAYESLLTTEASPTDIHVAFLLLGVGPMAVAGNLHEPLSVPDTNTVRIEFNWHTNGTPAPMALSDLLVLAKTPDDPAPRRLGLDRWLYNGSVLDAWGFAAQREGSIIALIRDPAALVNNPAADRDDDTVHWPNLKALPPEGTRGFLTFRLPTRPVAPPRPPPPWASPITPHSTNSY